MSKKMNPKVEMLLMDKIETMLLWKLYYDSESKRPCGHGFSVVVAAPDENLPPYVNKPHWVEEREAVLYILKKKKEGTRGAN